MALGSLARLGLRVVVVVVVLGVQISTGAPRAFVVGLRFVVVVVVLGDQISTGAPRAPVEAGAEVCCGCWCCQVMFAELQMPVLAVKPFSRDACHSKCYYVHRFLAPHIQHWLSNR